MEIHALRNKITLGDSLKIMAEMPAESVGMVATDPPYGVNFHSGYLKGKGARHNKIAGDKNLEWLGGFFTQAYRVLKQDRMAAVFYGWPNADKFLAGARKAGFRLVGHFVWVKPSPGIGYYAMGQHECVFLFAKGSPPQPAIRQSDVVYCKRMPCEDTNHPTPKPVDLMAQIIRRYAHEGEIVLDPFAGSCATAFACRNLGLDYIAIEISEEWHADAARRMAEVKRQGRLF
ncbi:MAG: DNA methyltransferase [Rickettsiales bacterium]